MAELQTQGLQLEDKPVYNVKAAQKEYRQADEFAGDKHFAEAEVWKAGVGFTSFMAGVVGEIEGDRQEAIGDEIIQKIEEENLLNTARIDNELPKIDSTDLSPTTMMESFAADGLKTGDGMIKMQGLEEYKGYEFLGKKQKSRILKHWQQSEILTKQNLIKQIAKLSREHKLERLTKLGADTINTVLPLLNDQKNWNDTKPAALYVKELANSPEKIGPGGIKWREYWIDQLMQGNPNIPGAPEGGAKIEDLGVKSGLKPEIKRSIDQALERHSQALFEGMESNAIEMSDVHKHLNDVMQKTLLNTFHGEFHAFPQQAINKARNGEYTYTRSYGEAPELGEIKYVLDPAHLRPYIKRWDDRPPKSDNLYVQRLMYDYEKKIVESGGTIDPEKELKKLLQNEKLNNRDVGLIYKLLGGLNVQQIKTGQLADATQIVNSWSNAIQKDPKFLDKLMVEKNGKMVPREIKDILQYIPDEIVTEKTWSETEGEDGKWVTTSRTTKGHLRKGGLKISKADIQGLISTHIKLTQKWNKNTYEQNEKAQTLTPLGRDIIFDEYGMGEGPTDVPDEGKLREMYNNGPDKDMIQLAYPFFGDFLASSQEFLSAALQNWNREQEKLKKTVPRRLLKGDPKNDLALENAIKADHKDNMARFLNMSIGQEEPGGEGGPGPIGAGVPRGYGGRRDMLLQSMRDAAGDQTLSWTIPQQKMIDQYDNAFNRLIGTASQFRLWTVRELAGESHALKTNKDKLVYYMNKPFAAHVQARLQLRLTELLHDGTRRGLIEKEIREERFWQEKFGIEDENELLIAIGNYLGIGDLRPSEITDAQYATVDAYNRGSRTAKQVEDARKQVERTKVELNNQNQILPVNLDIFPID
jgi:hypothetical protein